MSLGNEIGVGLLLHAVALVGQIVHGGCVWSGARMFLPSHHAFGRASHYQRNLC